MTDDMRIEAEALIFDIAKVEGLDEDVITGMIVKRFKAQRAEEVWAIDNKVREMYKQDRGYRIDAAVLLDWLDQRQKEWET